MEIISLIKKHLRFNQQEVRDVIICALVIGFIFSFGEWGTDKFDAAIGIKNLMISAALGALALLVHISAQKITALKTGYEASYKKYIPGLLLAAMLAMLSNGKITFIIAGGITLILVPHLKIGHEKPLIKHAEVAKVNIMGPIASVMLAFLFKAMMSLGMNPTIATKAISINNWIAISSMIPLALASGLLLGAFKYPLAAKKVPSLTAEQTLFGSRLTYIFGVVFVIACSATMHYTDTPVSIIASAILGLIAAAVMIKIIEL